MVLKPASMPMTAAEVQILPSVDVLITRSFAAQVVRWLQSDQTTKTVAARAHCCGREVVRTQEPAFGVVVRRRQGRDWIRTGVGASAIGGYERFDRTGPTVAVYGNHDGAVGKDDGYTRKDGRGRNSGGAPVQSAVSGCCHRERRPVGRVVIFDVTISGVIAGQAVVADDPVLVEVGAGRDGNGR